jgi:hypothetical protein
LVALEFKSTRMNAPQTSLNLASIIYSFNQNIDLYAGKIEIIIYCDFALEGFFFVKEKQNRDDQLRYGSRELL